MEHTTVTKKPSGWQKYDSPSYEKLPSGKHNTKKSLLTRVSGFRQDGEVETHKVHTLENGGSNPSPAICQEKQGVPVLITWAGGAIPQAGSSNGYSSGKKTFIRLELSYLRTGGL